MILASIHDLRHFPFANEDEEMSLAGTQDCRTNSRKWLRPHLQRWQAWFRHWSYSVGAQNPALSPQEAQQRCRCARIHDRMPQRPTVQTRGIQSEKQHDRKPTQRLGEIFLTVGPKYSILTMKTMVFVRSFGGTRGFVSGGACASTLDSSECNHGNPAKDSMFEGSGSVAAFIGWIRWHINIRNPTPFGCSFHTKGIGLSSYSYETSNSLDYRSAVFNPCCGCTNRNPAEQQNDVVWFVRRSWGDILHAHCSCGQGEAHRADL